MAAPITSQPRASEFDLVVTDWQAAGLNVLSIVRVHKLTVLAKADIVRRLGVCSSADREALAKITMPRILSSMKAMRIMTDFAPDADLAMRVAKVGRIA